MSGPQLGQVGIWSNGLRYDTDRAAVADSAAELEELGFAALWLPDVGGDVLGDVEHVLDATRTVPVLTGILNIWRHGAAGIALGCEELDRRHAGRFTLGLGASHGFPGRRGAGSRIFSREFDHKT